MGGEAGVFQHYTDTKYSTVTFVLVQWHKQNFDDGFLKQRMEKRNMPYFQGTQIFLTCGEVCCYYNGFWWENVNELVSNQEEADTRLLLHSQRVSRNGFDDIMIHTLDTDVFLLMLSMSNEIAGRLYMKTGTRRKIRMIDIADVKDQLDGKVSEQNIDYVLEALPGLHAFTGFDTVSAFSEKGKINALKIMLKYEVLTNLFQSLGQEDNVSNEIY